MNDMVELRLRRQRGWPWPESSFGRTPMYGEDGWCPSCGLARREQCGPLTLQRKNMRVSGAWAPYWRLDAVCVEASLAAEITSQFSVRFREILWPDSSPSGALQMVVPVVGERWFDPAELSDMLEKRHGGNSGAKCAACGVWKWLPAGFGALSPVQDVASFDALDVVASPEQFGDRLSAFRQVLMKRGLAELIQRASPRDFEVADVRELQGLPGAEPPFLTSEVIPVPAGLASIFYAQFDDVAAPLAEGVRPSARALHKAAQMRALLQGSKGLISADALASIAQTFFEAGEDDHAFRLWRQAADQGSAIAQGELDASSSDVPLPE